MNKHRLDANSQNTQITEQSQAADKFDLAKESEFLQDTAQQLIKKALAQGASQAEVGFSKSLGLSVKVRDQQIETLEYNQDSRVGLTVYFDNKSLDNKNSGNKNSGNKKGMASSSDLSVQALDNLVDAACNIAKYTQADACSGLPEKTLMASKPVALDLDHPMGITADLAKNIALECEQAGLAVSKQIHQSEGATFSSHRTISCMANSHEFSAITPSTRHSLSAAFIAKDKQGMQKDYWYSLARNSKKLESAKSVGERAANNTLQRLQSRKIKTQKAPVLMIPEISRGLISTFCAAIRGSSLYRKSSFLLDSLGKPLFPEFVNFNEAPFEPQGLASSWHDADGLPTAAQAIVLNGELQTYLLDVYSARRLNMQPTGHAGGVHNLKTSSSENSFEDLINKMHKGLIVTDVMGQGINMITGDYSRGASGFWVENGKIQHFVEEITIAGNLKNMYANLVAIGNDFDFRSSLQSGSWLLEEMTIAAS